MNRYRFSYITALALVMVSALAALTARGAAPKAPSNLSVTVLTPSSVRLTWTDNSTDESGFYLGYHEGTAGDFYLLRTLPPNTTSTNIVGTAAGTTYQFLVESFNASGWGDSEVVTVTMPGITSRGYHPAVVGQPFAYTLTASSDGGAADVFALTGTLPGGLSYDAGTHQLTGTPTEAGVFTPTLSVRYPAWGTVTRTLTLRVIHPPGAPVVKAPIPTQTLTAGGSSGTLSLNNFFADRDAEKAVRFVTTRGAFDVALYATATPLTVINFLNYVNRGDYGNSIVHRVVPDFIIQGGGFKPAPPDFTKIATDPSPLNEPGIQNLRGTIAMAKLGNNPNSATDQWFVNLSDNSANLDNQNGGFTAFGRVCGNGLAVADAIAALPRGSYTNKVDGQSIPFTDWPMATTAPAPTVMDQSKLVLVSSVTPIEPLAYAITGNGVAGLVTSQIDGGNLVLTPAGGFGGVTTVTVTATDLDGNSVAQTVAVQVDSPYTAWLNQFSLQGTDALPGTDKDGDALPNVVEFALAGSPLLSDVAAIRPTGSLANASGQTYAALTFKLRKTLSGAVVTIEASSTLAVGSWTPIWTSSDLTNPRVVQALDGGDHWLLTVRDPAPFTAATPRRFLRLLVATPP